MGRSFLCFVGLIVLCCTGCAPDNRDTTLYQRSGRQKAIVAVLPCINKVTDYELTWDLSREFTDEIRKRVYDSSRIYLLRDHGSLEIAEKLNTPNPSMISREEINKLGAAEFVIVAELIDQTEVPYNPKKHVDDSFIRSDVASVLNVSMRVRVIDIRNEEPKVILQEILNNEHVIAGAYKACDYSRTPWGTEAFQRTPLGMAHGKIVRELVTRVENYVEAVR